MEVTVSSIHVYFDQIVDRAVHEQNNNFLLVLLKINRVHIITWNVSSKYPENLPVHSLFGLEKNADNDHHRPDIYVIG